MKKCKLHSKSLNLICVFCLVFVCLLPFFFLGERYDFVISADQPVGAYWVQVRGLGECGIRRVQQLAILRYARGPYQPTSVAPTYDVGLPQGVVSRSFIDFLLILDCSLLFSVSFSSFVYLFSNQREFRSRMNEIPNTEKTYVIFHADNNGKIGKNPNYFQFLKPFHMAKCI